MDPKKQFRRNNTNQGRSIDGFSNPSLGRPINKYSPNSIPRQSSASPDNIKPMPSLNPSRISYSDNNRPKSLLNASLPINSSVGPNRNSINKPPKIKKHSKKKIVKRTILAIILIIVVFGGYLGIKDVNILDKVFHGNLLSDASALFGNQVQLNGESTGRVNILLAGWQGKSTDEGPLTDSIMIVSVDTKNHTAFTMSIPRDLWVHIPGNGYEKINAANDNIGFHQSGYFNGGMGQLQQIIEQDMGIPINYYALVDYQAFEDAVNAVGGVTVDIKSPDPRGLYDPNVDKAHGGPLKLPNGPVTLNGLSALALALARGDSPYAYGFPLSDINRAQHQRQILIALEQKATSVGVLSNPLDISKLIDAIGNNVKTNLSLADVLTLAQIVKGIGISSIGSYGLSYGGSNPLLTTYLTSNGQDALIPKAGKNNYSQIQSYYQSLIAPKKIN